MNEKYPEDYPEDFEEKLIEAGATTKEVKPVYRILYDGMNLKLKTLIHHFTTIKDVVKK